MSRSSTRCAMARSRDSPVGQDAHQYGRTPVIADRLTGSVARPTVTEE